MSALDLDIAREDAHKLLAKLDGNSALKHKLEQALDVRSSAAPSPSPSARARPGRRARSRSALPYSEYARKREATQLSRSQARSEALRRLQSGGKPRDASAALPTCTGESYW